jgi:rod shape-determining protein MreB
MTNWRWIENLDRIRRVSFQWLTLTSPEKLAIDLGAANTRVYVPGEGVTLDEPSVIAFDVETNKMVAVGRDAKLMARCQPRDIRIVRPVKDGVITDTESAGLMLSQFIRQALRHRGLGALSLLICAPANITGPEIRAYEVTAKRAGAGKVTRVEAPYVAAIGADLNMRDACACMIVDLGAATTDIAVLSSGNVLHASTLRIGGSDIDRAIARHLQMERKLEVGEDTAEEIKIELGRVDALSAKQSLAVRGRNLRTGLPEEVQVTAEEIHQTLWPILRAIKQQLRIALEEITTEASVDLLDTGITLSGGLAQIPGLPEHINEELGMRVRVAHDPLLAVVLGAGSLLDQQADRLSRGAGKGVGVARLKWGATGD